MSIQSVHAGHGGRKNGSSWTDPGAIGCGYKEADVARTITAMMVKKTGVKDVTDNTGTTANAIVNNVANNINKCADGWHISNHLNAFNGSATGVEVLYGSLDSKPTAAKLSAAIAKALGLVDRGAKDGTWLGIARNSGSGKKVLLIEWGFIDNKKDMQALMAKMEQGVNAALQVFGYQTNISNSKLSVSANNTGITVKTKYAVGSTVKVKKSATHYFTGEKIADFVKGSSYKVKQVKTVNKSRSQYAFLLDKINSWVLGQDLESISSSNASKSNLKGSNLPNRGAYKFTENTNIRAAASTSSAIVGSYSKGETVNYDSKVVAGGYVWLSWIGASGNRRYAAVV
ncbi:hypothetical protein IGI96_000892 [Enterococcus sp. DIV0421]|uniref:N-acetylmuramoyl-L-alanine amidase n=1 Tax=Enterococcus sp. DIV0421 TaxID=2774688 RepID=UPI003F2353F6